MSEVVRSVLAAAGPAVVRVGRGRSLGAGLVLATGRVLTNAHNLGGPETAVAFTDGTTVDGQVTAADVDGDLAVVTVDTGDVAPLEWADAPAAVGDHVVALALTRDGGVRATLGLVSATGRSFRGPRGRRITGGIEHTAPMARGSSGGPLLDGHGRLVGINTHRLGEGFYLALPADADLRDRVAALTRGEARRPAHLGVALAPPQAARRLRAAVGLPERDGLLIHAVEDDSPASHADLRRGDLIVSAAGDAVSTPDDLFAALERGASEGRVQLKVIRGVEEVDVQVAFDRSGPDGG